jgi:hypothetical protein
VVLQHAVREARLPVVALERKLLVSGIAGVRFLGDFEADVAGFLGASFADPDDSAALRDVQVFLKDQFNQLASTKQRNSAQTKTVFGRIDDQTGKTFLIAFQVDDQTGAVLRVDARGGSRRGSHVSSWLFLGRDLGLKGWGH